MMIRIFFTLAIALGACLSAHGQTQGCLIKLAPIKDTFLKTAVTGFLKNHTDFSLYTDEFPCSHLQFIARAFSSTLRRDYLSNHIQGYETATFLWKDGHFSIERFIFKNKKALQRMESTLKQRKYNDLVVKSVMHYDYFVFESNIFFLIAEASGCEENARFSIWKEHARLFREIERDFMAAATAAHGLP